MSASSLSTIPSTQHMQANVPVQHCRTGLVVSAKPGLVDFSKVVCYMLCQHWSFSGTVN